MKDFDDWNRNKKYIDEYTERLFFKAGQVWWVNLGLNIGYEMNGKGWEYARPVIILKKYNRYSFMALPLSTSRKTGPYRIAIGVIAGKEAVANASQIRNLDSKRLVKYISYVENNLFSVIKKKTSQLNFGWPSS